MTIHAMPTREAIVRMLGDLLGRPVSARRKPPIAPTPKRPLAVAIYVDVAGNLVAAWFCDLVFAASSGAALVMLTVDVSSEAVETGRLPVSVADNFGEVVNVVARLFNSSRSPHVKLREYRVVEELPAEVVAFMRKPFERLDLEIAIEGYTPGRVSVLGS